MVQPQPTSEQDKVLPCPFGKIDELVQYLEAHKKMLLLYALKNDVSVEDFGNWHIKLALSEKAQTDFINNLQKVLQEATGRSWEIEVRKGPVGETLADKEAAVIEADKRSAAEKWRRPREKLSILPEILHL